MHKMTLTEYQKPDKDLKAVNKMVVKLIEKMDKFLTEKKSNGNT